MELAGTLARDEALGLTFKVSGNFCFLTLPRLPYHKAL
jgi:hypothetical protein